VRPTPGTRRLWPLAAALAVALAGCDLPTFGAPDAKSEQGESITSLWQGFFLTAIGVAVLVWGLLIYVVIRYRRRRNPDGSDADDGIPSQRPYNVPLEIAYTAAPVVVVAVLFGFSVATQENVNHLDSEPAAVVEVVGFQWSWQFVYPDEDVTITGEPGEPPEMVLPVGEPSRLVLRADDVDHSFWVPDFLSKRDLIPGVHNEIDVTPTEPGQYIGRCAEFCGLDHWRMNFSVRVVPEAEYQDWLDEHRAGGSTSGGSTSGGSSSGGSASGGSSS
jgi:cytochrome c oxidase subunit 2